ncbi:exonuclease domain-containing protein [Tenacibaculum sp. IB213877]|uniref:exonuclease domain-containing protein n=1 Tax=Tenacibaculum sp. IB213877 TaxID=3097351 RepID=UPI002A5A4233|nr:exonuclease domain-containing protein [Tenacibaculum sp. IB213877]MDY0779548.1 exonuclease domain-containing protein [Tenacibaculum sp. IB213877]
MYAILDIETTGGKFNEEGITEIAIYKFDGHQVVDQFISLVNPEREIQEFVVKLTGINNKMLRNAPKFHEVAKRIIEITEGCVIVAHNSSFDYRILKTEYKRLGYNYQRNSLCTVNLSKKLIPEQPSYSLGKLCRNLGIPLSDRHRATGDALATVQLFKMLLEKDLEKEIIQASIKYIDNRNHKKKLTAILDTAPETEGVFYLHNEHGNVIYLGRGKNIKKEVSKLFLKSSKRAQKISDKVKMLTYEETGNQLITRLKYYIELEALKPRYNLIRKRKLSEKTFSHHHLILVDKGRIPEENSIVLIENGEVIGYTYTNLAYQENHLDVLKNMLTPIENKVLAKNIVKNYLLKNKVEKIIRFQVENNL